MQRFVEAVPAESGMAFVVVVHLDGDVEGESEPGVGTTFMYGCRYIMSAGELLLRCR